ncbi:MAG: NAD(P)-dependent alcohol dehydrogenase [Actinomycetota bacterium]
MQAVVQDRYGPPEHLRLVELPVPTPGPEEVLIEVRATAVNLSDWETLVGSPAYARIGGLRRPRRPVLGSDIAGVVTEVGAAVAGFSPGDEVFADNLFPKGGFARYAAVPTDALAVKPPELSFAEAAAIPQSGAIALQGTAGAGPGSRVLINGAGGGTGAFAIQVAKAAGAHVTGVDTAAKLEFMAEVGADEVIDYRTVDVTRTGARWDLFLDLVAHRSVRACRRALAPGGVYRAVGGSVPTLLRLLTVGTVVGQLSGRRIGVLPANEGPRYFLPLARRCAEGELQVHLDRIYPLAEAPEALARVGAGHSLGKVIVADG